MLKILYTNPTGMFSYGYSSRVDFEDKKSINLVGVNEDKDGSSNGAGKSSLFNSICELLFGENPTGISGPGVVNNVWDKGCCGRIEFISWENIKYRVTLCRDWKESSYYESDNDNNTVYSGTGLFLDRLNNEIWEDYRGEGIVDTKRRVIDKVGITYNRFLSTSYMSNRVGERFLRGTNKNRLDILSGITGIEEWDPILSECRKRKDILDSEINNLMRDISFKEGSLQELRNNLVEFNKTDWNKTKLEVERNLSEFEKRKTSLEVEIERVSSEGDNINTNPHFYGSMLDEINNHKNKILELRNSRLTRVESKHIAESRSIHDKIKHAEGRLSDFIGGDGYLLESENCPTCGVKIKDSSKQKINNKIESMKSELESLNREYGRISNLIEEENKEFNIECARYDQQTHDEINEINKQVCELEARYNQLVGEDEKRKQAKHNIDLTIISLEKELSVVINEIFNIPKHLETCDSNIRHIKELEDSIVKTESEINLIRNNINDIEDKIKTYKWLIHNIPYIKIHKLSISMSLLSDCMNKHLSDINDTIRVNIEAFKEKKSKSSIGDFTDLLKGEVSVEITDGIKNIDSKLYSDGEIGKISNILVRSLREVALIYGYGCNILMLDEVFSFMDYDNSQRLASSFMNKDDGTIIITDNSGKANNLINFDDMWVARKQNGITTLEVR